MKGYSLIVGQYLDELKSDDSKKRLNSVEHLLDIAKALGADRTRNELFPFLKELLDDEEEILVTLARSQYELTKFVGGSDITKLTFPSYEALFANEDTSVREAALEYLSKIISEFGAKDEELFSMARRLFNNADNYASRISSIMIFSKLIMSFSSTKQLNLFKKCKYSNFLKIMNYCSKQKF